MRVKNQTLTAVSLHAPNEHRVDCDSLRDAFWTELNLRLFAHCPDAFIASERCTCEIVNRVKWM